MIFKDIATSGTIILKILGNELSATSLGLTVLFFGALIIIFTIRWPLSETSVIDTIKLMTFSSFSYTVAPEKALDPPVKQKKQEEVSISYQDMDATKRE
jgi:hypothetical protein